MTHYRARAALSHPAFCGLDRAHLGVLIEELADPWLGRCESGLRERRGGERKRAAGAGPDHKLVFTDRVLVTVVHLRLQLPHAALAELYGVSRPTVTRAIHEIRPLLASRGFAVPDRPGIRLHTLADVFAYAKAECVELRIDGTETQVRRPQGRPPRPQGVRLRQEEAEHRQDHHHQRRIGTPAVVRGRPARQNARPDRDAHRRHRRADASASAGQGEGRRGIPGPGQRLPQPGPGTATQAEGQSTAGRELRLARGAPTAVLRADLRGAHHRRGEEVAAAPAVPRRRDSYAETHAAIAGLVSDRAARRPTRRHTSTELVPAWKAAC